MFLACGLHKPHLPFAVPRKYYDRFPLEKIELPPHQLDDLADIPPAGVKMAKPKATTPNSFAPDAGKLPSNRTWQPSPTPT